MISSPVRRALLVSLPLGVLVGATGALAGVSLLEEADNHVDKAILALKKADNQAESGEYGGHRKKAIDELDEAKHEIKKAKEFVASHPTKPPTPPPPPPPKPAPTSSGPKKPPPTPPTPPKKPEPSPPKKPEPPATPPKK